MSTQLLVFSVLVMVAAGWWALQVQQSRRRRMRRLASDLRASYHAGDRDDLGGRFAELAMWQYGHTHRLNDVVKGVEGPIEYWCFADSFDVGFGRERARRVHLAMVAATGRHRPEAVGICAGHFTPCGPHAHYEPWAGHGGAGGERGEVPDWQVWCRPGDDAGAVWERLQPVCGLLSGPCLIETRGEVVAICHPGRIEPGEYRRLIEVGLETARALSE